MRLFKPKFEYIWAVAIEQHSASLSSEKDWNKIDQLSDTAIIKKYRVLKKKTVISEGFLEDLTARHNAASASGEDTGDILSYMGLIIDVLKMQYFFLHSIQEIIQIRDVIKVGPLTY